jgi:hypothetical protein
MKFRYMDPNDIISIIVVLIVLGIGVYAFFVTTTAIQGSIPHGRAATTTQNQTNWSVRNATLLGGTVFNILGIVITIGAIMSIIGVIYSYLKPRM